MKRDGACESLWQSKLANYDERPYPFTENATFDVVIVGGGITGVTTALLLQQSGKKCLLAEAHNLGFGTTGGTTAHINTLLDTPYTTIEKNFGEKDAQAIAEGTKDAISLIKSLIDSYDIDCEFSDRDAFLYAQDNKQNDELDDIVEATNKAGVEMNFVDHIPVPIPFTKAAFAKEQACFHPAKYIYGLAQAFESAGGVIVQQCRVTKVQKDEPLTITTSLGSLRATDIIYATHIPPGVNLLHFRCAPYRSYAMAVTLNDNNYPAHLAYDMYDPYHYYRTQEVDGKKYLIAGGEDHKTAHEENTTMCFDKLEAYVRRFYNVREVAFKWSSQYFESVDGLPYIGHLPGHPDHLYVATGFGGNGMTFGTLSAIILNDILTNKTNPLQEILNPNRIKPVAGFASFVKEAADVVGILATSVLPGKKLDELVDLAYGEARIVKYEGESMALYKDEHGQLHAVNPACTHIKCSVAWNSAEKSWDCPCHGSRFSYDGEVLTGPARKDLQLISLGELVEEEANKHPHN
jgi:glycine/D-amino acid oxidase-like deaminating enzyme/nitrite reductase/ring-hydroxylating ferredoxin subunit